MKESQSVKSIFVTKTIQNILRIFCVFKKSNMKSSLGINHKTHYDDRPEHKTRNRKNEDI